MRLDADDLAASALWGAHECLRYGVTSIADTSYGGGTVASAALTTGLRARVYLEVFSLDDDRLGATMERLSASLETAQAESGAAARLEWGISPHAPYTVSQPLYREVAELARRSGLRMASHVAESTTEVRLLARGSAPAALAYRLAGRLTGGRWRLSATRPVQYLAEAGALGADMLAVHAVQVDRKDIDTLAASGSAVAHCPRSNTALRCGEAPVVAMRMAGITVGLGTDSLASNESLDMLAEMRAALQVSQARATWAGTCALAPSEVVRMATLDGACALGWGGVIGSLEAGKRADIAVVYLPEGLSQDLCADDLARAVMGGEVRVTILDGEAAYSGGAAPPDVLAGLAAVRLKLGAKTESLAAGLAVVSGREYAIRPSLPI